MIRINLLPKEHIKVEHTPLPRLIAIFAGVGINAVLLLLWVFYAAKWVPDAEAEKTDIESTLKSTQEQAKVYDELKAESDRIQKQADMVKTLQQARLPLTIKWDELLSLLPDNIWFSVIELKPELPPKSTKDEPQPAGIAFLCHAVSNPYGNISEFRKYLQGQVNENMDTDRREKIQSWAKDVKLPLPTITGFKRVQLTGSGENAVTVTGYEWVQEVLFTLRGKYEQAKAGPAPAKK